MLHFFRHNIPYKGSVYPVTFYTLIPYQIRYLSLAPPFLLDNYTPKYLLLSPQQIENKRKLAKDHLTQCNLCPRFCDVNRYEKTGACLIPAQRIKVNTIAPHFGEEPCLQGHNGSGAVFFAGCSLRCVFCQNFDISHIPQGFDLTYQQLAEWLIKLQNQGNVHNINLVTPEHVIPQVVLAIIHAAELGLNLPIIYNTSSYDTELGLELLNGLIDIYLPDFKFWSVESSKRYLKVSDYATHARKSIKIMYDQVGDLCFTPDGIAKKGVLLRHLVMPGYAHEGVEIVKWLAKNVSTDLCLHIMEQYYPRAHVGKVNRGNQKVRYAEINRPVNLDDVNIVKTASRNAGLWRFVEAARHDGFNI